MNIMELHLILRILVGAFFGGIIGYERDLHGRPAGLRTHILVAMASATFMVVSTHFVYFQNYQEGDFVEVDASRIAASVVSGIGFLAGGAIFRTGFSVQGLTTAAALWLVAAIGLSAGSGMYLQSAATTIAGVLVLTVLRRFEDKDDRMVRRRLSLRLGPDAPPVASLMTELRNRGASVWQAEYEKQIADNTVSVTFDLRLPASLSSHHLVEYLETQSGVRWVRLDPLG